MILLGVGVQQGKVISILEQAYMNKKKKTETFLKNKRMK